MNLLAPLLSITVLLTALPAYSQVAFMEAPGFSAADITQSCSDTAFYTAQRFPQNKESAFRPDADLDAVSKSVLLVDCAEGPLPHARYLIRYHLGADPSGQTPRTFLEILRFNVGPQRYQSVIEHVAPEFWPPKSIFGVGPNLAWRFVISPIQGNQAHVERAARAELTPNQAAQYDCLGTPCLSLSLPTGPKNGWRTFAPPDFQPATFREPDQADLPGPARTAQMLFLKATGGSGQTEFSESASLEQPEMVFVVSKNVAGQDSNSAGLLHESGVMDDAVAEIWTSLAISPGAQPTWRQNTVHRAGRH